MTPSAPMAPNGPGSCPAAVSPAAPGSGQALLDEGKGELREATPGGLRDLAQRPRPGEHGQPVHRGPDRVLDALAAAPVERARVDQLVEHHAKMTERRALRPGPAGRIVVVVLLRHRERGGEQ